MSSINEDEYAQCLQALAPELLAYFERRVRERNDAADQMGELMVQAWRRANSAPTDAVERRMWLFAMARNIGLNHSRSARRRHALSNRLRLQFEAVTREADAAEAMAVRDAVHALPPGQRELVMLVHWDGFTIEEAAQLLGVNPSTARSRYAAARSKLKMALAELFDPVFPRTEGL